MSNKKWIAEWQLDELDRTRIKLVLTEKDNKGERVIKRYSNICSVEVHTGRNESHYTTSGRESIYEIQTMRSMACEGLLNDLIDVKLYTIDFRRAIENHVLAYDRED